MKTNLFARTVLASFGIGALFGSSQLMADPGCINVRGNIVNSFQVPALGGYNVPGLGVSTLGVVSLNAGPLGKMKCALAGVVTATDGANPPNPTEFDHTISCDDEVEIEGGIVHSQLTFDTTIESLEYVDGCTMLFTETSVPQDGKGLGVFYGVNDDEGLNVEGTINGCTGSIDMKFTGKVCYTSYP